ncbi:hypothetical protein L842_6247 [Mycobacterium intracellulare MIN_052511_1280]|nr:hypothetical protein L842_6247 [Mycobacterium intracellulare MIN_052511_1280]
MVPVAAAMTGAKRSSSAVVVGGAACSGPVSATTVGRADELHGEYGFPQ